MINTPVDDLSEEEQARIIVAGALEHSDFTIYGADAHRIWAILKEIKDENGILEQEDFLRVFKSKDMLVDFRKHFSRLFYEWPRLDVFYNGVFSGDIKLQGGQVKKFDYGIDLLKLFEELTERFGFRKGIVYEVLAEHLLPGHTERSDNLAYTVGAEKIRQDILKLKKQRENVK